MPIRLRACRSSRFWVFTIALFVFPLKGCTCYLLEFDRMDTTTFPANQVVGGETVSLSSIYEDVDMSLSVVYDDTDISQIVINGDPLDPTDEYITIAELESGVENEDAFRDDPNTVVSVTCEAVTIFGICVLYRLYGAVVDYYYESPYGVRDTGVLGVSLHFENRTRTSFAIFYKNSTIASDPARYLRTTAHEIGHVFNLHHPDGDKPNKTIMVTNGDITGAFLYGFSTNSQTHLESHPRWCVRPNGSLLYHVGSEHHDWHGGTVLDPNC